MANQVTFQIKIETLGAENVKNVTMDAEELGRVVHEVTDEQEKLNAKLLDINQAQQAIQNVVSGISQIASEIRTYTSAYALQETAEAKVAQVMRNTMAASDAEIESIKALCSAQQELGVIGDEVQLAGAQELATYLEKKSSLEQLLPVMNDMLAQQYGLEASQESAAQIATMLGKVMEGQTSALSRYGYSFDEAQEKVLKFGTEEERAAVLAEVVSQSVGGYESGKPVNAYGFEIFQFANNPYYGSNGQKKAVGAEIAATDRQASFAFWKGRVFKASGSLKMYYRDAQTNPQYQRNEINFRHYFIALPKKEDANVAIYSGTV
jgi:hypothetical protein